MKRKRDVSDSSSSGEETEEEGAVIDRVAPILDEKNKTLYIARVDVRAEEHSRVKFFRNQRIEKAAFCGDCTAKERVTLLWLADETHTPLQPLRCEIHGEPLHSATVNAGNIQFFVRCSRRCFALSNLAMVVIECERGGLFKWNTKQLLLPRDPQDSLLRTIATDVVEIGSRLDHHLTTVANRLSDIRKTTDAVDDRLQTIKKEAVNSASRLRDVQHDVVAHGANVERLLKETLHRTDRLDASVAGLASRIDVVESSITTLGGHMTTLIEQQTRLLLAVQNTGPTNRFMPARWNGSK
jgi:hypothetical protein